jgi:dolichol-phosphate mannosyltransferase
MDKRFLAVIPAYNEADTIEELVLRASEYTDVCVVDDASTDGTGDLVEATGKAHCIRHEKNTHIAGGLRDGLRYAVEQRYDHCITMDAGLSHDPDAIPQFMRHHGADLVVGVRDETLNVPAHRRSLSWGANALMNLALEARRVPWGGAGLRDITSGYRMYSLAACELLVGAQMQSTTFDFHIEALAYVFRAGMQIEETPIRYEFTNSSLRWPIVADALRTCVRVWTSELR